MDKTKRNGEGNIRVAIVGVGNCASSLVQGLHFYRSARPGDSLPGLMHASVGGYLPRDLTVSAAFDVDSRKIGRDVADAIFARPNNTRRFAEVPLSSVQVHAGNLLDGFGKYTAEIEITDGGERAPVADILRATHSEVVVCYLPVGSEKAARWYAEQALLAGCAFVNCIPVFLASSVEWQKKFEEAGLPIIGDDIKSQVGATIVHRALVDLFRRRGIKLDRTYQLNFGGNTDFLNMLERERLESKKKSKTNAVRSLTDERISTENIHVGPSDFVSFLGDQKYCYIQMEGTGFGDSPMRCEVKLEVWDSPNSAGVVIDAVRCAKLALDRGLAGAIEGPASYFMKSPPKQVSDDEAHRLTEAFIAQTDFSARAEGREDTSTGIRASNDFARTTFGQ